MLTQTYVTIWCADSTGLRMLTVKTGLSPWFTGPAMKPDDSISDKILVITGSGSGSSPVWCKPLQPNWYIINWTLKTWLSPLICRCKRLTEAWWHHIATKFWSPLVWVMTCHQFSAKPLHAGLGQFNSKIGIAAQLKFQNWKWNWKLKIWIHKMSLKNTLLKLFPHFLGANEIIEPHKLKLEGNNPTILCFQLQKN